MFHNTSDSALQDLALHDVVPGTFSIESSSVKSSISGEKDSSFTKESSRDGNKITWAIGRIETNERIEVLYEIQGDTESEYKVSDAQDFHGATFGKEVDDEPNVPEWADKVSETNLISVPISRPKDELIMIEESPEEIIEKELVTDNEQSEPMNSLQKSLMKITIVLSVIQELRKGYLLVQYAVIPSSSLPKSKLFNQVFIQ